MNDGKTYRLMLNGQDIRISASAMARSRKRAAVVIKALMPQKGKKNTPKRFWMDIIVLNIMTTKILKKANPYELDRILNDKKEDDDE